MQNNEKYRKRREKMTHNEKQRKIMKTHEKMKKR